jgi:hypothetical protein
VGRGGMLSNQVIFSKPALFDGIDLLSNEKNRGNHRALTEFEGVSFVYNWFSKSRTFVSVKNKWQ